MARAVQRIHGWRRRRTDGVASGTAAAAVRGSVDRAMASFALVVDESPAEPDLDQGDEHDDEEQQPGQRRRESHVEELERLLEQVDDVEQGGVVAVRLLVAA